MSISNKITLRHIEKTPAIDQHIRDKLEKMNLYFDHIESCNVVVTKKQNKKHTGKLYSVSITVLVPGKKLVVNRRSDQDLYVAVRDSFSAMTKQIQSYAQRMKKEVKFHEEVQTGSVNRLYSDYGFIEARDGSEYYFQSENVMHHDFDNMREGMTVRFIETVPGDSPRAGHVGLLKNGAGTKKAA